MDNSVARGDRISRPPTFNGRGSSFSARLALLAIASLTFGLTYAERCRAVDFVTLDQFDTAYAGASGVNNVSFRQNSLTSVMAGGQTYQFSAYYRAVTGDTPKITIARRVLGVSDWQIFDYTGAAFGDPNSSATDGHNVISIGVDGDGYMHMSWGMHNNQMIYRKSTSPVTNASPIAFGTTNQAMTGDAENSVTYPQFYNLPDGDLLYFYRNGSSGNGNTYLNRYDTATDTWSVVQHPLFDGVSSSVNAYPNTLAMDSQNRLHLTWTDRSTPAFQTNHNIYYARSANAGATWTKMNGTPYALPMLESTSEVAVTIPQNSTLINQTSMTVDKNDRPIVASWWAPGAAQGNNTRQYMLAYYNGSAWQTSQITSRPIEPLQNDTTVRDLARPLVMVDDDNRAIVVMRYDQRSDVVTVGYSLDRQSWKFIDLTSSSAGDWEPTYDGAMWQRENKLHLFYQPVTGATESTLSTLEWDAKAYFKNLLSLRVDRATGVVSIVNDDDDASVVSQYAISSLGGHLSPGGWNSLQQQGVSGWTQTQSQTTALAENNATGALSLAGIGSSRSLGAAFAGAVSFGIDATSDLSFQYVADGVTRTAEVNYVGVSTNNLTLLVDPATGLARLQNTSPFSVAIDGYAIKSAAGSLAPGLWQSLDDQNAAGGGWQEANPSGIRLSELLPAGEMLLASGMFFDLGALFVTSGGTQDLALEFLIAGQSANHAGIVQYASLGIPGDYNDDGVVSSADYVVWRHAANTNSYLPHDTTPGFVTQADYDVWRAHFGQAASASASSTGNPAAAVPEPSSIVVLLIVAGWCAARGRRICGGARWGAALQGALVVFTLTALPGAARAVLVDNFQTYSVGTVSSAGNNATAGVWTTVGGTNNAAVQNNAGTLVLSVGQAGGTASGAWRALPTPIADNTTATVFLRVRANLANLDGSIGLSDVTAPSTANFADYETQFRIVDTSPTTGIIDFEARNGANFQDMTTNLSPLTWYNVWMVVNSTTNMWDAYVNTGNANATVADRVGQNMAWRNGTVNSGALTTLLILGGTSSDNLAQSIDDVYVSSGTVLTNLNPDKLGDTDGDGVVELGDDFNPIRDHLWAIGISRSLGDLNRDGVVDFYDFREWKTAYVGAGGSLAGVDLTLPGVPEPASIWLVILAVSGFGLTARRSRRPTSTCYCKDSDSLPLAVAAAANAFKSTSCVMV